MKIATTVESPASRLLSFQGFALMKTPACFLPIAIASLVLLACGGCVEVSDLPAARPTPGGGGDPRFANVPARDRVLAEYRLAAGAMRTGNFDEAKKQLDDALLRIGGLIAGPDD